GEYAVTMVNNLDWIGEISALDFLRDMGKHFRMGTMLAKDTVARRLQSDEGISYTEFSYQVLQASTTSSCTAGTASPSSTAATTSGATSWPVSSWSTRSRGTRSMR